MGGVAGQGLLTTKLASLLEALPTLGEGGILMRQELLILWDVIRKTYLVSW